MDQRCGVGCQQVLWHGGGALRFAVRHKKEICI
jgi:hypothetical protein